MTCAEENYAQIEKENLAIVFGCERFDHYIYERHVTVETDHKLLESLAAKPIHAVPKRLQRMMLHLQKYHLNIKYKKGSMMYLADTLSRAYFNSSSLSSTKTDFFDEVANICIVEDLDVNEGKISEIKVAKAQEKDLKLVMELVKSGWPQKRQGIPLAAHLFYAVKDELSFQDELLFKSERVVVPSSLQRKGATTSVLVSSWHGRLYPQR